MEPDRHRPEQTPFGGRLDQAPQTPIDQRRIAALWPGQMVPRRIAAALEFGVLLAQRRPASVERRVLVCRRIEKLWLPGKTRRTIHLRPGRQTRLWQQM